MKNYTCLDAFSCSGNFGIEAVLRGCKLSILLEKNKFFFFLLKKKILNYNLKNIKLFNFNFFSYLKKKKNYDVIFIDSPYIKVNNLFKFFKSHFNFLKKNSFLYIETVFNIDFILKKFKNNFKIIKNYFYNKINFFILKIF